MNPLMLIKLFPYHAITIMFQKKFAEEDAHFVATWYILNVLRRTQPSSVLSNAKQSDYLFKESTALNEQHYKIDTEFQQLD